MSVVVIAGEKCDNLRRLLDGLCDQTSPAHEIIIASSGSRCVPESLLASYRDRLPPTRIAEPAGRVSAAHNRGVAASKGSIIAFLGEDCTPCPEWLEAIAHTFSAMPDVDALQGTMLCESANGTPYATLENLEFERFVRGSHNGTPESAQSIDSRNFAIRRDVVRRFRMPFDERLDACDGTDLFWKLKREGARVAFCEDMRIAYRPANGLGPSLAASFRGGISKGRLRRIHDDYWDNQCFDAGSPASALSWFFGETRDWRIRKLFRALRDKGGLIGASGFYPTVAMQRLAFGAGYLHGQKRKMPKYDHFVTPAELYLSVTNKCNLRCKHCFYHSQLDNQTLDMSAGKVEKLLSSLNRDLRTVSIAGGEPFLNEELVNICWAISDRIHLQNLYIISNGFYTSRIIDAASKILDKARHTVILRMSLDGLSDTHNDIRGNRHSFEKAIDTIKHLLELAKEETRLKVEVQTTICRQNYDELASLADFVASEFGVFQAFEIVRDHTMFKHNSTFLRDWYGPADPTILLTQDQLREAPGLVEKIYARHMGKGLFNRYQMDFQLLLLQINCQQPVRRRRLLPCTTGESIAIIDENYDVSICEMTRPIGNLAEFDFDLRRLLYERFTTPLRQARDACYCSNSCNNASSILTGRMS